MKQPKFTYRELWELKHAISFYLDECDDIPVMAQRALLKLELYFAQLEEEAADNAVIAHPDRDERRRRESISAGHKVAEIANRLANLYIGDFVEMTQAERESKVAALVVDILEGK